MPDNAESVVLRAIPVPDQQEGRELLPKLVTQLLKLGEFFYVIGFVVIMVHTARLNVPVVDALHFQNILAGLPIGLLMLPGFLIWRPLTAPIVTSGAKAVTKSINFVIVMVLSVPILFGEISFVLAENLSVRAGVLLAVALLLALSISLLFAAYNINFDVGKAIAKLMCVYSLFLIFVVAYALFGYPNLPQSVGGGRPARIRLYLKGAEAGGGVDTAKKKGSEPPAVYLWYRTSEYLLVSACRGTGQPLIQLPLDRVQEIVWLDSRPL